MIKRNFSSEEEAGKPSNRIGGKHILTMIPGDGVGPELCESVKMVFAAAGVPVEWNEIAISDIGSYGSKHSLLDVADSLKKTGVAIKGALTTPTSINSQDILSLNQKMKIELDLFANVVHCKSFAGFKTRHNNIDVIIVREQTEGEYTSLEHETVPGVVEMIKVITRKKSERIAKFAFDYATMHGRKKVTAIHKANIMKLADGMFLNTCEEVSKLYPKIQFQGMIVDNACMQMVSNPQQFDVLVVPNLYGNIIGNVAAGLVGGAGVVPGKSIGSQFAIFEPGARHTYAQMAGRNVANPTAMLLSGADMLDHINLKVHARTVRSAVERTISTGKCLTMDMGGSASTSDFVQAVIENIY